MLKVPRNTTDYPSPGDARIWPKDKPYLAFWPTPCDGAELAGERCDREGGTRQDIPPGAVRHRVIVVEYLVTVALRERPSRGQGRVRAP